MQIANAFADYQLHFTKQFISGASDRQLEDIINNGTDAVSYTHLGDFHKGWLSGPGGGCAREIFRHNP